MKATAGNMKIILLEDSEMLAEVEVVAYGVQRSNGDRCAFECEIG